MTQRIVNIPYDVYVEGRRRERRMAMLFCWLMVFIIGAFYAFGDPFGTRTMNQKLFGIGIAIVAGLLFVNRLRNN